MLHTYIQIPWLVPRDKIFKFVDNYYYYYNFIYSRLIKINKNMYIYNSQITNKVNKIKQK